MKKNIAILLSALILSSSFLVAQPAQAQDITVTIDGEQLQTDQAPIIQNGRTLVPLRSIFEALGAEVTWYQASGSIYCYRNDASLSLTVNDHYAYINGSQVYIDQPPIIVNNRTLVPVRVVSEALGATVVWGNTDRTVTISSNDSYTGVMRIDYEDLLPDNLTILPPDSLDTRYIEGNYINNTPYPVLSYSLSYLDKGTTETWYFSSYDTVLSGSTSPKMETFAPESGRMSDVQFQKLTIRFKTPHGEFYVEYDYQLHEIADLMKLMS